jgi:FemAB family protein
MTAQPASSFASAVEAGLSAAGIELQPRYAQAGLWADTCARLDYIPVDYSIRMIDYQLAYWNGNGHPTEDASVVLLQDKQPCAVWPVSLRHDPEQGPRLGSNGGMLLPPLFVAGLAQKTIKRVTTACLEAVQSLCRLVGHTDVESGIGLADCQGLGEWHHQWLAGGASASLSHRMFVNLAPTLAEIKSGFRKSYKSLVSAGNKLWNVQTICEADPCQWEEFHKLHIAEAGRVTRSEASWQLQHEALAAGEAFLVRLRDGEGRMVGAGFFHLTRDEGLYAVGAYDRSLFTKPLGHVVQYHAIEEMKRRGLRWYRLGVRPYPADVPAPSPKELGIGHFKQGFASHLFPIFHLRWSSMPAPQESPQYMPSKDLGHEQ